MRSCWLAVTLGLAEQRLAAGALPVLGLLAGIPLAFALRRVTGGIFWRQRLGIGLAAGFLWTGLMGLAGVSPAADGGRLAWFGAAFGGFFRWQGGPTPVQLSAAAAALSWLCGWRLASGPIRFNRILTEFQLGLVILLPAFFCAAQWGIAPPALVPLVCVFFLFFFIGGSAAQGGAVGGWLHGPSRSNWLAVAAVNALAIIGAGALAALSLTPDILHQILAFLEHLWNVTAGWIKAFFMFLAHLIPPADYGAQVSGPRSAPALEPSYIRELLRIPAAVRTTAEVITVAVWVALIGVSLWRLVSHIAGWLRRRLFDLEEGEVEILQGAFRWDLLRLLGWIRRRLAAWGARLRAWLGRGPVEEPVAPDAAAVRRIYRALLHWAAAQGCRRRRCQTPYEFLERLSAWLPEGRSQLAVITERYVAVRYGGRRPGADTVKSLELAWQNVRQMRKQRRKKA
jgi:hypothetical protein